MIELTRLTVAQIRTAAEAAASDVLAQHWAGGKLPVDPVKVARRLGVEVYSAQLGNDVWGFIKGDVAATVIYVDDDQPPNRYRFTVAHELGHYVAHGPGATFVDRRSDADRGRPDEVFANHYAGALLMPADTLELLHASGLGVLRMADRFGVSYDALKYRLHLVGLS